MAIQGTTNNDQISPALIQDNETVQTTLGVDGNDSNLVKWSAQSSGGATMGNPMVTLDASANGNVIITPNGTGTLQVDSLTSGLVIADASSEQSTVTNGTDGQVLLGATGADPAFATITSTDGTVSFVTGANSLDLSAQGTMMWNEETDTGPTTMAVDNGYIANNAAQVDLALPTTAAVGSVIRVTGKGDGGWKISQAAGQSITWDESTSTTTGVGGSLESSDDFDSVELICLTADTLFGVLSSKGNITVT